MDCFDLPMYMGMFLTVQLAPVKHGFHRPSLWAYGALVYAYWLSARSVRVCRTGAIVSAGFLPAASINARAANRMLASDPHSPPHFILLKPEA